MSCCICPMLMCDWFHLTYDVVVLSLTQASLWLYFFTFAMSSAAAPPRPTFARLVLVACGGRLNATRYCFGNRFGDNLASLICNSGWSPHGRELTLQAREVFCVADCGRIVSLIRMWKKYPLKLFEWRIVFWTEIDQSIKTKLDPPYIHV